MIRRIKYHEINFEKYSECIENSVQRNFYAQKEILDELCESWEILISGDYDAVMPLPLSKKFGVNFVLVPLFCQQLGVFSRVDDAELNMEFASYLKNNFRVRFYAFNHVNTFPEGFNLRKNYFIEKQPYGALKKNYSKGRKSTVKTAQFHEFRKLEYNHELKEFAKKNFKGLKKKADIRKFFRYVDFLNKNGLLIPYGSFNNESLTSLALTINAENISLLALFNDERFRKDNGASFLIDRIIQENIDEKGVSFMGGNLRGIEVFFKSFGASLHEFSCIQNSVKDLIISFFFKN